MSAQPLASLPALRRHAQIPAGVIFWSPFGEALQVVRSCGADPSAPVIVLHIAEHDRHVGQYALWSAAEVQRRLDALAPRPLAVSR